MAETSITEEMYRDQADIGLSQTEKKAERMEEIYCNQVEIGAKDEEEIDEHASSMQGSSSFLLEMNLVMIISSLALSNQELLEYEDMDKGSAKERDVKASITKLKSRKREFDQLKFPEARATRIQTRVLDSRHGRRI